jgi:translocation and assembly module TamA
MPRPLCALVLLASVGAAGCLRGRGTSAEPVVTEVELEGVHAVDTDDLRERLATREPERSAGAKGLVLRVRRGFPLDPDALAVDRRRVEAYYRERGYYGARVEDVRVIPDGPGRAKVVLRVREGQPVRVTTLVVKGLDDAPDARARVRELPLREGDVFTVAAYDASKGAIEAALRRTGWALAEVTQSAHVLPDDLTAEVTYDVRPGPRLRFGPIFVAGTSAVSRDLVKDQAAVEVKSGAWFDEAKLSRAQARVFDLGVFAGVRVTLGEPNLARGIIPVVVAVREAPFRTLRFGPGIAIEATRWEARGTAGWTHRNLLGDLRRVGADLTAGYAWVPSIFARRREGVVGQLGLEYAQPAAITRRVDTSARLELERGLELGFQYWSERLQLALPIRLAPRWTLVPSYNLEVYQLRDVLEGPSTSTGTGTARRPLLENCTGSVCLLSFLEQRIAWDGRDDPLNTRRGLYVALSVQEGFNVGGYGYRYLRFVPELRGYLPFGKDSVLAARARVGGLIPVNEDGAPPVVARFYGGGPISMRGYYSRELAPQELQGNEWVPVGGNGLADASVELRFGVGGGWGSAVFLDAGSVSRASGNPSEYLNALAFGEVQLAAGAGVRYGTPFGPIRLDVGFRLPTRLGSGIPFDERFPGVPHTVYPADAGALAGVPHREPIASVHLSIGEPF